MPISILAWAGGYTAGKIRDAAIKGLTENKLDDKLSAQFTKWLKDNNYTDTVAEALFDWNRESPDSGQPARLAIAAAIKKVELPGRDLWFAALKERFLEVQKNLPNVEERQGLFKLSFEDIEASFMELSYILYKTCLAEMAFFNPFVITYLNKIHDFLLRNESLVLGNAQNLSISDSEYQKLLGKLSKKEKVLKHIQPDSVNFRNELQEEINVLLGEIENYKRAAITLADAFRNMPMHSERLLIAISRYSGGDLQGALGTMKESELDEEHVAIIEQKKAEESRTAKKLFELSGQYIVKAALHELDVFEKNANDEAERMYLKAINVYKSYFSLYAIAVFYNNRNAHKKAIEYFTLALDCGSSFIEQAFCHYSIGTAYIKNDLPKAQYHLELAAKLCQENKLENAFFISVMANTFHNLASLFENDREKMLFVLGIAFSLRKSAEQLNSKFSCLTSYTSNRLGIVYFDSGNIADFVTQFELSLSAMEVFFSLNHDFALPLFQESCLADLISQVRFLRRSVGTSTLAAYKARIARLLLPFEQYIRKFDRGSNYHAGNAYYQYLKTFLTDIDPLSDECVQMRNALATIFEEVSIYLPADNNVLSGLALSRYFAAYAEIAARNTDGGVQLFQECLSFFEKIPNLDDVEQVMKANVEAYFAASNA